MNLPTIMTIDEVVLQSPERGQHQKLSTTGHPTRGPNERLNFELSQDMLWCVL